METIGRALLIHGDCLQGLASLPDNSVDMVCCDLPYGTTLCKWDTPIDLTALWSHYCRVVKPRGAITLFAQTPFAQVLGCSNLPWLRYEIIWEKVHASGHLTAKRCPMRAHENILVFYRKPPTYNPQKTTGHRRSTGGPRVKTSDNVYGKRTQRARSYDSDERYPRSVQVFAHDDKHAAVHPTQKPVALLEWLVKTYTNPGELVLDNCMGSGSTGVACARTGRRFVGMELDEEYFNGACERIAQTRGEEDERHD